MSESLGYLISDTGRLLRKAFDERAREIGITRPQWRVLAYLSRQPGISQSPLAELLEVEPISLSRMIDRLEDSGMVERRADPQDRRAWRLFLTAKAEPVIDNLRTLADQTNTDMMRGLDDETHDQLCNLLGQIRSNLQVMTSAKEATLHG